MPLFAASQHPRSPFAGAAPLAHRPLSAIAATAAGGVPQARIKRLLGELVPQLASVHEQGHICGDITVDSVGLDESGRAHLLALNGAAQAKPRCRRRDTRHSSFMWRILPGRAVLGPTSTH